jgi:hypothetical protein
MATRVRINDAAVIRVVAPMTKRATKRAAEKTALRAARNVLVMGLVDSGELAQSFRVRELASAPLLSRFEVYSTAKHAKYPEFGRGPIDAKPGKFLVFKPKGAQSFVFAKHVGPVRAYGFMKKAKQQLRVSDFVR